jgi:23S rRNA (pseudouridine1915-N3)-methyltransferase
VIADVPLQRESLPGRNIFPAAWSGACRLRRLCQILDVPVDRTMRIVLAGIGRMKKGPDSELGARYLDRAAASARSAGFTGVEIREFPESQARKPNDRMAEEAASLIKLAGDGARLVLLDERGKGISSRTFAEDLAKARDSGVPAYVLALGGPDGHGDALRERADLTIAFGAMTWPHQLARIMAAEQIYRAITILTGHPYHRE